MSSKTPLVAGGLLREPHQETLIVLGSAAWHEWLADERHCSFHFSHPAGEFTARRERKQRGQTYWVAYRQAHKMLFKRYLGKSDALTEAHLIAVAADLSERCQCVTASGSVQPPKP
jgi:LuxR family transcriptional regulator, maltose regulon positive regulatory protein